MTSQELKKLRLKYLIVQECNFVFYFVFSNKNENSDNYLYNILFGICINKKQIKILVILYLRAKK